MEMVLKRIARRIPAGSAAILALALLAGCNTGSGSQIDNTLGSAAAPQAPGGGVAGVTPPLDEIQDPRAYCPRTVLRAGTETYNVYPDRMKPDDPEARQKLRFRATITDAVRECNYAGDTILMKVGIAGRVLAGPSGEPGSFAMPIRIAITQGDAVLYSKLHEVPAEVPVGRTNNTFQFVDSAIQIPKPPRENVIVYVGYDELREDAPGAQAGDGRPKPRVN